MTCRLVVNGDSMTPRLETPRLVLRHFTPEDWDEVSAMLADSQTIRYMHFAKWTEDQRRQWFDWCVAMSHQPDTDAINWVIARKDTGQVIGWFGIGVSSDPGFGYLLSRTCWNQGYMTEALEAVLEYEFNTGNAARIHATCDVANPASARVMEKVGMHRQTTVYDADFEGNWAHRHHYAVTKAEYEAGSSTDPTKRQTDLRPSTE